MAAQGNEAGLELTGELIQQGAHLLHVSNGLSGKMAIRSVFRGINKKGDQTSEVQILTPHQHDVFWNPEQLWI